jgi:hypothetical protein
MTERGRNGKDLEEVDGVTEVAEGRVQAKGAAEPGPNVPDFIVTMTCSVSSDAGMGHCFRSAEISEEFVSGLKWHS